MAIYSSAIWLEKYLQVVVNFLEGTVDLRELGGFLSADLTLAITGGGPKQVIGATKTNIGGATVILVVALSLPSAASAGGVASIISDLYGGDGIILSAGPDVPNHTPHFTLNSQAALNDLSGVIASNANIFALPAASASYTFDLEAGIPVRTTASFGPILTERPQTIGQGNVNVGFFFSRTVYEQFEGDDLNDLTLPLSHVDCCPTDGVLGPPGQAFELDTVSLDIDLELEQTTFAVFGTYGITGFWDVSALVPLVYVDAEVDSVGTITDTGGGGVHLPGAESLNDSNDDSAFGFGDIVLRTKANLTDFLFQPNGSDGSWTPSFGVLGQATLETGDEDDLLGQGESSILGLMIAAVEIGNASPHVNLGYEVATGNGDDLNNLRYAAGLDGKVTDELTAAIDVIGRYHPDGDGTRDIIDLALGTKWDPFGTQSPISLNFLLPINKNTGLRPDYTWSVGFDLTF